MSPNIAFEASQHHLSLYDKTLDAWQQRSGRPPKVLDFGTGRCGAGRVFLEPRIAKLGGELHLYDPHADILPSCYNGTMAVKGSSVYGPQKEEYDIVNLSYVLGTMPEAVAGAVLRELRANQPRAVFVVVDYILRYRSKAKVLDTLTTDSEMRIRKEEGEERFAAMRSQHDVASLSGMIKSAGLHRVHAAQILDSLPSRLGVVTSNEFPHFEPPIQDSGEKYERKISRRVRSMITYALGKCAKRIADANMRKPIEALACELHDAIVAPGSANGDCVSIGKDVLAEQEIFERSCLLEERLQTAVSTDKKILLPMLKARKDVSASLLR